MSWMMVINDRRRNKPLMNLLIEMQEYHALRILWNIGHIQYTMRKIDALHCKCCTCRFCRCKHIWMEDGQYKLVIYGHYVDKNGIATKELLGNHF